jgi:tRNA 5-methylaminomethyl-2-thiouridine biosynthesis bifunctional protein
VTPAIDGLRCAGATFCVDDQESALRQADHAENLAKLDFILPGYSQGIDPEQLGGRVGFRPLSPDRLPMIGALADATAIDPARPSLSLAAMPRLPGLYLINGFGARGIVWSALAGELLACLITGAPLPLADDLVSAVDPGRFLLRGRSKRWHSDAAPRIDG